MVKKIFENKPEGRRGSKVKIEMVGECGKRFDYIKCVKIRQKLMNTTEWASVV